MTMEKEKKRCAYFATTYFFDTNKIVDRFVTNPLFAKHTHTHTQDIIYIYRYVITFVMYLKYTFDGGITAFVRASKG